VYLTGSRTARRAADAAEGQGRPENRVRVPFNVKMLGTVSLLTDVSSEMFVAILGYYLIYVEHQSPDTAGFLDGLYVGIPALLAIPAAYLADRWQRRKALAGLGYGLSAVTKLGFPAVGPSVGGLGGLMSSDRLGKGLRSAPRDALISLSTEPEHQARSFGVHRMMDTVGAFLGPLLAALMLALTVQLGGEREAFDAVFVVSFCVAAVGLAVFWLYVTDHREPALEPRRVSVGAVARLVHEPWFFRTAVAVALLGLATVSDTFVYLTIAHAVHLAAWQYALLATGTTGTYLLLAIPMGNLADRIGRWKVFVAGHVALVAAYLLLASSATNWLLLGGLLLPGFGYAATDGVLMAYCGPKIPRPLRATGMAVMAGVGGLAGFGSSVVFGAMWSTGSPRTVMLWYAGAMAVAVVAATLLVSPWRAETDAPLAEDAEGAEGAQIAENAENVVPTGTENSDV
jgi:MFS family permease